MASGPPSEASWKLKARVYRRMEELDRSVKQVLVLAGVSRSAFYEVVEGKKQPTVGWLTRLAAGLDCTLAYLVSGEASRIPAAPRMRETERVALMSAQAAAAAFLEGQNVKTAGWVRVPPPRVVRPGMFAAVVSGRSMEPKIGNGSVCLFDALEREDAKPGEIVLVQLREARDSETGGRYTVKEWQPEQDGSGRVVRVRLVSLDPRFKPMVLKEDPKSQVQPIARFLAVLVLAPGDEAAT